MLFNYHCVQTILFLSLLCKVNRRENIESLVFLESEFYFWLEIVFTRSNWGPFLERPGNFSGPKSDS